MSKKKIFKLSVSAIGIIGSVATVFAGFAFSNFGLGLLGVLSGTSNIWNFAEALRDFTKGE